jgi:D-3-phosphoglycerate dehydrogenase
MKDKAYVTEPIHEAALDVLKCRMDVIVGTGQPVSQIRDLIGGCTFILSKTDPVAINREIIDAAPRLRHIARHGSGYSNVDVDYASRKGISVSYVSGVNAVAIAEYTMGLMLLASRKLVSAVEEARKGAPERSQFLGVELFGKTLGVIGLGTIGREVVRRAAAFGMKVVVYHPRPQGKDMSGIELVSKEELLSRSDVISLHVPLTRETRNIIDREDFERMKRGVFVLNLGRGGTINEAALIANAESGHVRAAVLDVVEHEPVAADDPILRCPSICVLPHIAAMTEECQAAIAMEAVTNILRVQRGEKPPFLVNDSVWNARTA